MSNSELDAKNLGELKKALVLGEEARINELVSLILEDLGFQSMLMSPAEWLVGGAGRINPELIIWDLSHEENLDPFHSFKVVKERCAMNSVRIMFLGKPGMNSILISPESGIAVYFCMKPFSPAKLKHAIGLLYKGQSDGQ